MSSADLEARLSSNLAFFENALELVPASYYYPQEQESKSKFMHKKSGKKSPKDKVAPVPKGTKPKVKPENQAKYDPSSRKTIQDVQRELQQQRQKEKEAKQQQEEEDDDDDDDEMEVKEGDESEVEDEEEEDEEEEGESKGDGKGDSSMVLPSAMPAYMTMDMLRKKLQDKIGQVAGKRKRDDDGNYTNERKERAKKQKELKKKLAKEKEEKDKKNGEKRKQPREKKAKEQKQNKDSQKGSEAASKKGAKSSDGSAAASQADLDLEFGQFTGVDKPQQTTSFSNELNKKKGPKTKTLLKKVEKFEEKLQELKQEDPKAADELLREKSFTNAMLRAQGVAVKDDKKLLKKALKREEQQKKKSKHQWADREKQQKLKQKEAQDKKAANVAKRMDIIKKKNAKKIAKKSNK